MDANLTELRATENLLERGVKVRVRAPFLLRLIFIKTIVLTLHTPRGGSLLRMGSWFLRCQLSVKELEEISMENAMLFQVRYGNHIYRALACLFIGNKTMTYIFSKRYARWLKESLTVKEALQLLQLVILYGGLEDFMTITRFVRAKTISPPKMGQITKTS